MAPLGRLPATSCPVVPGIPPAVIPPKGFEPVSLPTLGRNRQHRPGLHLYFAPFTGPLVFAGSPGRVVGHSNIVDTPMFAADGVSACRTLAAGGPALSTLSISSQWRDPFCSSAFTIHNPVIMSYLGWHISTTAKSQAASNCRRTSPAPTNWDNRR